MEDIKVRENRLRRSAQRQGLRLVKSRSRDPRAMDYGLYALINVQGNYLVHETLAGHWPCALTLDEVEERLTK